MNRLRLLFACSLTVLALAPAGSAHAQFETRGLIDVVVADDDQARHLNWPRTGDSATDPLHTRLFFEGGSERTRAFVQFLLRDTSAARIRLYGAYFLHQVFADRTLYVQAGKIPTPQGTWGPRTYSDQNPLIGVPLMYMWQSTLYTTQMPVDLDDLVSRKGTGQFGSTYEDEGGVRGTDGPRMLVLYDNCWHDGAAVLGIERGIEYQIAVTTGAPGSPITGIDDNDELALHARLGWAPVPEIVLRASWGRGAYLSRAVRDYLPSGRTVNDYHQQLWMGSMELSRGHWIFHGEAVYNQLETPLTEDGLDSWSAYADLTWKFAVGWSAALRFDTLRYGEVPTSGGRTAWDQDVDRWEIGVGYDVTRDFLLKAVVQSTDVGDGFGIDTTIPAVQAVVRF
jgi:hypothetical protein